jgi:hypothetical protein
MKKIIKWFFRILVGLLGLLIIALIVIPVLFKDELLQKAKQEINNNVNAKVEFTDFKLSLLKSFPDLNIGMYDLSVVGIDKFEKDTLMYFKSFNVEVNLMSAIKKKLEVNGIVLINPVINAIVLEDSTVNWDIAVPVEEIEDTVLEEEMNEVESDESTMDYRVKLTKFQIKNAIINYSDETSDMVASINDLDFLLKGDFGLDYSDIDIETSIEAINVKMAGLKYLKDAAFGFDAVIGADLENMIFTFEDNLFTLNDIALGFEGVVKMLENDIDVDLKFGTRKTSFKSLLSMVPSVYLEGFEDLKTEGSLALSGDIKGIYNEAQTPSANIRLVVENAMFQYPDLPKSVENIGIDLSVHYDGLENDNTKVDLNKFHMELANNPFDFSMKISTPFSDPYIKGALDVNLILKSLSDALPLEDMNLDGEIIANVQMEGNLSSIENEKYEDFKAKGKLQVKGFLFESGDLPASVKIIETTFNFTPQFLELKSFDSKIGESDFQLNGKIENYIAYALNDGILRGDFNLISSNINANEFIADDTAVETTIKETEASEMPTDSVVEAAGVVEIPENIEFGLSSDIKHIVYDNMDITDLTGIFLVKDQKVIMNNLRMNLLEGYLGVNGEYNTQDITKPKVVMGLDIREIEIESALNSFSMLESIAPVLKHCKGKISLKFDYTSLLDAEMSPVLNSIDGYGRLKSKSIQIVDSKTFDKLIEYVKVGDDYNNEFKNIDISFNIKDGRINVEPFDVNIKDINMNVGGSHGIDQTMDYLLALDVPRAYFGSTANDALEGLLKEAEKSGVKLNVSETIKVKARIIGTTTDPKITFNLKDDSGDAKQNLKQELKKKAEGEVRKEIEDEAQKIIDDAEKESAKLKQEARVQSDEILKKGNEEADALVKKASKEGYLAKIAAETAAKEVKKEAKKKANDLVLAADKKADKIVEDARIKAAAINKEN